MIGRSGERGSGISVLAARQDDDDLALYDCPKLKAMNSCYELGTFNGI